MPDDWETKHGLEPKNPADAAGDLNGDGYTNIEDFLNGLDPNAPKVEVADAADLCRSFHQNVVVICGRVDCGFNRPLAPVVGQYRTGEVHPRIEHCRGQAKRR